MITRRTNIIMFRNRLFEEKIKKLNSSRSKNSAMITRKRKKDFNFHRDQLSRSTRSESSERRCDIKDFQSYQNQETHAEFVDESKSQSSIHSLKRDAMTKQNASESLSKTIDHEIVSNQRINAVSKELFINKHKNHDFCSELCHLNEINTTRDLDCSIKYFLNLNTNNTIATSEFRNDRKNSDTSSRHLYDFRTLVSLLTKTSFDDVH